MIWVSDLAVLAIKLGMTWLDFRPNVGSLRAEGNGLVLTSMQFRSMGCAIHIQRYALPRMDHPSFYIPTRSASDMLFGLVPDRLVPYPAAPPNTVSHFRVDDWSGLPTACSKILQERRAQGRPLHIVADQITIVARFMRQWDSTITRVPAPMDNPYGVIHSETCRLVYLFELQKLEAELKSSSPTGSHPALGQISRVLEKYLELAKPAPGRSASRFLRSTSSLTKDNALPAAYLNHLQQQTELLSAWLWTHFEADGLDWMEMFSFLTSTQFEHSILAYEEAEQNVAQDKNHKYNKAALSQQCRDWNPVFAEATHLWFERLPLMYRDLQDFTHVSPPSFRDKFNMDFVEFAAIWVTIMFRAFAWDACHYMVEVRRVGSEYHESKMPIYIT